MSPQRRSVLSACLLAPVLAAQLAGCQHREGRLVAPPTPEAIVADAATVARVRVISRDPIELPYKNRTVSCGSYYRVQGIEALKGDAGGTLDFVADEALDVGAEYLVTVSDTGSGGRGSWDSGRLRCRASYERVATGSARVRAGEDGVFVVVAGSRMLPERIRDRAVGGEVPWPSVQRELLAAAPQAAQAPPSRAPLPAEQGPETPERSPEARPPEPAPQQTEPEPEPAEKNPWLPWNWEFEWL